MLRALAAALSAHLKLSQTPRIFAESNGAIFACNSSAMRMFSPDRVKSAERERRLRQIVAVFYIRLWDLCWLSIGFISHVLWQAKLFPPYWQPWLFGARLGRWPEKINDEHYTLCRDADCETCSSLFPGELDIDDKGEIKHDPFDILANLRRRINS